MRDLRQIGYIGKNVQGNRVYDANGVGVTLSASTGGIGGKGVGLYAINHDTILGNGRNIQRVPPQQTKPFKYAELFGGILGFGTALDELGGNCVFISEIDPHAQTAIKALGKGGVLFGDITKVNSTDIPQHDVLTAGFPCPSFSVSGNRGGMEYACTACSHEHLITFTEYISGASCPQCGGHTEPKDIRGLLFFEVARVAQASSPRIILLENVKGLLSSSGGAVMKIIKETLDSLGYAVDYHVLNSKYFGVPQSRERVFIVAVRKDVVGPVLPFNWPEQTQVTVSVGDILFEDVDDRYYLTELQRDNFVQTKPAHFATIRKLSAIECWRMQGFSDESHNVVAAAGVSEAQRCKQAGNAVTVNVIKAIGERLVKYL